MDGILQNLVHEIEELKQKIEDLKRGYSGKLFKTVAAIPVGADIASDARLKENVITLTPSKYEALGVREVREIPAGGGKVHASGRARFA